MCEIQKAMQEQKREDLIKLTTPLIQWLNQNYHPHVKLIIEPNGFELVEGQIAFMQLPEEIEDFSNV